MKDAERLFEAIGEIRDGFVTEPEEVPPARGKRLLRNLAAACAAVCLIALPVRAEMTNGYVSNLLAPLYGGAQTELVDSIGVPVGASTTVGDYTLTADAVIGDRYHIAVVFTLARTDGAQLPAGLRFDDWLSSGVMHSSGGGYMNHRLSGDQTKLYITEQWTGSDRLFWIKRDFQTEFRDLVIWDEENREKIPVQEGQWKLRFTIRYEDTTEVVWRGEQDVTGEDGGVYTIEKVLLSPIGIHMEMTGPNFQGRIGESHQDFTAGLVLKDGRQILFEDYNIGFSGKTDALQWKCDYGAMFDEPIPREDIRSLLICGTEIPIEEE